MGRRTRRLGMGRRLAVVAVLGLVLIGGSLYYYEASSRAATGPRVEIYLPFGIGSDRALNFVPANITVAPGTTVVFVNNDTGSIHNIDFTSYPEGAAVPNNPSPDTTSWSGNEFSVVLTTPGVYRYQCDFHSWMVGSITVS